MMLVQLHHSKYHLKDDLAKKQKPTQEIQQRKIVKAKTHQEKITMRKASRKSIFANDAWALETEDCQEN